MTFDTAKTILGIALYVLALAIILSTLSFVALTAVWSITNLDKEITAVVLRKLLLMSSLVGIVQALVSAGLLVKHIIDQPLSP